MSALAPELFGWRGTEFNYCMGPSPGAQCISIDRSIEMAAVTGFGKWGAQGAGNEGHGRDLEMPSEIHREHDTPVPSLNLWSSHEIGCGA
ncbi:hypothetical protein MRB53_011548 [Persea americana]|uniref:Uncharacterized protein n=1 Tax=Persea americana TaxID=3435 RepID=A0ACC2LW06_PERAE|nr:hypothetical protein MRB53_011548 [Persea americana]